MAQKTQLTSHNGGLSFVGIFGEQFSILARNVDGSTNVTVRVTFNWEELF